MLPECSVDEVNLFSIPHHYADRVGGVQSILLSVCCSRDLACLGVGSADDGICFCAIGNKNASRERLFIGKSAFSAIYCCGPVPGSIMISKGDRY